MSTSDLTVAPPGWSESELEPFRRELTGYCYRMLGSGFEAEDAVQETFLRAWRKQGTFEGRASLRSWLYRIATNVCLDMLGGAQRRARPMDLADPVTADHSLDAGLGEHAWILPVPDAKVLPDGGDPAEVTAARETIRLAFAAALQHLPPRQRAVLILREVLRFRATEVADLLDTTVVSVNSALQRARGTLDAAGLEPEATDPVTTEHEELLDRYVDAFESYDVDSVVSLMQEDVAFSMPPYRLWLRGPEQVAGWLKGTGSGCRGSRLVRTAANGRTAFGAYRVAGPGLWRPFAIQVLEVRDGRIADFASFLQVERLFPAFGLPAELRD